MFRHGKIKLVAIALAAFIFIAAVAVMAVSPVSDTVKLAPAMVSVDTSTLPPDAAQAEVAAVWRLFDRDTEMAYMPSQTARVTVSLPELKTVSRIRVYGASSYMLNVYRDNAGVWEPVPSLSGKNLTALAASWNTFAASESFTATHIRLDFVPQGNVTAGIRELELWGPETSTGQESAARATLEGIRTPEEALTILASEPSHILEFSASPSELSVTEAAPSSVSIPLTQDPALFKRAYIIYDGYNMVRSVSISRRINNLSWAGGLSIPQPEGTAPAWSSYIEEINPAWLVQGENTIEFKSISGASSIRGLKLIVETDSGWNAVSSVSASAVYDGDTTSSYEIRASSTNQNIQINFERTVQPESIRLHVPGPTNLKATVQYQNGSLWQDVKTGWQIDFATLQAGWNEITIPANVTTQALRLVFSTSSLRLKPGVSAGSINELRVSASPAGTLSQTPRIVISYPRDGEYFGRTAYIQGFAAPVSNANGTAQVTIENKTSVNTDGAFSLSLTKDETRFYSQPDDESWEPLIKSQYGTQVGTSLNLLLSKNSGSTAAQTPNKESRGDAPFADNREKFTDKVAPGQAKKIQYKGVTLDIPAGAVDKETEITIIPLTEPDLAHLNPGMVNVTFPDAGYRFLPHGMKFLKPIKISFGYSKQLFAAGQVDDEVNMYYYDEKFLRWQKLNRMNVDTALSLVECQSDHFTDIINSTLVVPEHPQALSFNPNSIKDIKAADPSANIDLIKPPDASSSGTANLSYPIDIPKGRGAYTPSLSVNYSSSNVNGWMGLGWDIPISRIQVDARWGVPLYDTGQLVQNKPKETESYLLDGAALAPYVPRPFAAEVLEDRATGDKVFSKRVEGDYLRIIRKRTSPNENDTSTAYYWEVTDKNGTKFIYGGTSQARLSSYASSKNIFQWNLERVIDTNGNVTQFIYETDSGSNGEPFKEIYIKKITYTKSVTASDESEGPYVIEFTRSETRPDVIIDGKAGFQILIRSRLERIDVKFPRTNSIIRQYVFSYVPDAEAAEYHFGKSLINRITQKGLGGANDFYSHDFTYERMPKATDSNNSYIGFKNEIKEWTNSSGGQRFSESEDKMKSVAISIAIAPSTNYPTFGFQGNYGQGDSATNKLFMDVNGDGLPDHLKNGGGVELNSLNADRDSGSFSPALFTGIGKLGYNRQDNFSIGGQIGYWIAAANFAYSYNFVNSEQMMSDIDGDGFVDHIQVGAGLSVRKNDGQKFTPTSWNGYGTGDVDFGNADAATKLKGDFFLTDPIRKWIAPFKGTVRVTGMIQKIRSGGKDDSIDESDPSRKASVLAYIYKNNDPTPVWTAELPAVDLPTYSHDFAIGVVPGDRLYFRVSSVDDTDADDVSWQPTITYEQICVTQNGAEHCAAVTSDHALLSDVNGNGLVKFESGRELRLSGYPRNIWGAGAKGKVRVTGKIRKLKSSDDVQFKIKLNNTVLWSQSTSADYEGEFVHDFEQDVLPGNEDTKFPGSQLTFDVEADTTVDPAAVEWQPEVRYEEYCLEKPNSNPKDYVCGPVVCEPDAEGVVRCRIDVADLPANAEIDETDVHQYGQANYPLYYLTPAELSRFWVAPYDGKVRLRGDVIRKLYRQPGRVVRTERALAIIRGVNRLVWKEWLPAKSLQPGTQPPLVTDKFPHDVEISVSKGDQIFLDVQVENYPSDPAQFTWEPDITYSEYCTLDASNQKVCYPLTETQDQTQTPPTITEQYCVNYDDDNDGDTDRTVCEATTCPLHTGPESGQCRQCTTTTDYTTDPPTTQQSCQAITCTSDLIEGPKNCSPKSFIYKARPANVRYLDARYYDEDRTDVEAFAGGYRFWHYGDWNGNVTWDESKIKRTRQSDLPDEDSFNGNYKNLPAYYFVYLKPQWQGVAGYQYPVWRGRGENEYIGSTQLRSSRVGTNVSSVLAAVSGTGANTIQQSVSNNIAGGISLGPAGVSFSDGDSKNKLDFMDMNGDRFPDQVSQNGVLFNNGVNGFFPRSFPIGVGTVRTIENKNVSYQLSYTLPQNRQNAKGVTVKLTTPGASLGLAYGYSSNQSDLIDVNGDGLPDRVSRAGNAYVVRLNLGYGFSAPIAWSTGSWGLGNISNDGRENINPDALLVNENATFNLAASFFGIGGGASYTVARGLVALRDINGDGLADQVLKPTDGHMGNFFYVKLNRGDHFGPTELWNAPAWGRAIADGNIAGQLPGGDDAISYNDSDSYHVTGGVVIMIPIIPVLTVVWIDITPTVSISGGKGGSSLDFNDINGDGLPDHILKLKDSTTVAARINNVEQTNLLKEVRRPLGGKFALEYEHKGNTVDMPQHQWVLSRVMLTDGIGRSYDTRYAYGEGYQDRFEREFYGFDRVIETQAYGTPIQRTITEAFHNKDYYLKNLMDRSVRTDKQDNVWAKTANSYELRPVASGSKFPELRQIDTYFYDGSTDEGGHKKSTYERFSYDSYGNVATFIDAGELSTSGDDRIATLTYFHNANDYIVGKPDEILVKDFSGKTLRKRWALYDVATGNLKKLSSLIMGNENSTWQMTYDPYGNIKTIADPVGYTLTYTYDDVVGIYPVRIEDNFPPSAGGPYYSEALYNYLFEQPDLTKDLNADYQVNIYDEFGRLSSIYGPYDTDSTGNPVGPTATLSFEYRAAMFESDGETIQAPARAITKNKAVSRVGSDGNTIDIVTFVDGMQRVIQTKHETDANGRYGMTVSGLVVFDELGRGAQQGQPDFQSSTEGNLYEYKRFATAKIPTKFAYDPLDRVTLNMIPDSNAAGGYAITTMTYGFGRVKNTGPLYATTTVVDPEGYKAGGTDHRGTKITYKDVDEKTAAVAEFNNGSLIVTTYDHDPMGQVIMVKDDKGNTTAIEYDLMGRRRLIDNPDTGKTTYDYDANGNMTSKLTANYQVGKAITYAYDFNRLKTISYPFSVPVNYEYGAMGEAYNRAGRIKKVSDESGVEERQYGKLGEITKEERTIEAKTPPVQRKKFTTEYVYDSFGRMLKMVYPDGETLLYAYDNGGLLKSAWGEKSGNRYDYIKSLTYDEFDQKTEVVYGNNTKTTYTYDPLSRRLTHLTTVLKDGRSIQELNYLYDLVGNVKNLTNGIEIPTNTALPAGPVIQKYEYDDLYQLAYAEGTYTFGPGKHNTYKNEFRYDTIGNMLSKVQQHKIIQPSLSEHRPKQTNYALDYKYGSIHPHAVTDAGDKLYSYDAAGNMTGWTHKQNGTRRVITWNEENRIKQIDDNGSSTYFLYDESGERAVKRGQHGETIYVNKFYSVRNGELGTKHVFAGDTRVLSKLVKTPNTVTANTSTSTATIPGEQGLDNGRGKKLGIIKRLPDGYQTGVNQPVEKDLFFYHGDHLGSSNMITDAFGAVYQHLEYFPFGETWIEEGGSYGGNTPGYKFTGKELDPETGLYYYGARYYDPVLSKWLSPDPLLDRYLDGNPAGGIYVPQNLGVYTYTHNNPVVYVDPQGKWVLKAARIAWKVAVKGENLYSLVSGVVENAKIIADPDAGWGAKLLAATDIALDVTTGFRVKDIKKAVSLAEKGIHTLKDLKQTAQKVEQKVEQAKKVSKASKKTGSYTIEFESTKKYVGKGSEKRMRKSARRIEKQTGDKPIEGGMKHDPADSDREAFMDEAKKIRAEGGVPKGGNPRLHNKINSPGEKMLKEAGE